MAESQRGVRGALAQHSASARVFEARYERSDDVMHRSDHPDGVHSERQPGIRGRHRLLGSHLSRFHPADVSR